MKEMMMRFREAMVAATFAEAGEWTTARDMTPDMKLQRNVTWLDKMFMAAAFAESGLHDEALRIMKGDPRAFNHNLDQVAGLGLQGVRVVFGTVCMRPQCQHTCNC